MKRIWLFYIPYKRYYFHQYCGYDDNCPIVRKGDNLYYLYAYTTDKKMAKKFRQTRNSSVRMVRSHVNEDECEKFMDKYGYLEINMYVLNQENLCITELEYDVLFYNSLEFIHNELGEEYIYDNFLRFKDEYVRAMYDVGLDIFFAHQQDEPGDEEVDYLDYISIFSEIFYELL